MRRAAAALLLMACADPGACPRAALAPIASAPTYAVVASDYGASAIALLDADGAMLDEAWVDSGTARPGIVAALSGDVSLPSAPFDACTVAVLDRFGTDVVSLLDVCGQDPVRAQVDVGAAFAANPQDVLRLDERTAWVSRLTVNLAADDTDLDRGNDVAVVDVEAGRVIDRISLSPLDDGDEVFARPTRMARLRAGEVERVVVGTARLSADFQRDATGALAVVDPTTRVATAHPLGELRNCGELDPVPGDGARVVVTCAGATFGVDSDRRAGAGLVLLELEDSGALVERGRYAAADHPTLGAPTVGTVPLGGERAISVAPGDAGTSVDRVLVLDLADGSATELLAADAPFVLGEGAYDPDEGLLLVPDAARGQVRRFRDLLEIEPIRTSGCRGLPPREITRIR